MMMDPFKWQWMQNQGYGGVANFSFWFGGLAGTIITVEVIVLLWLWIRKLLKELK